VLERALRLHRPGPYQVQAAIAALHVQAPSWAETDWPQIRMLYDALVAMTGSPTARLGRAVATRYVDGPAAALAEADTLADALASYRLLHATRAELLYDLGRVDEARDALGRALALASNPAERELLARRLGRLPAQ
jgi:RNA polymerase sigma-70 factor (ECF subfamily)